jgi:hypothetical protein
MSTYLQDTEIELDEYAFKTIPNLVLYNAWLSVSVDRSCSRSGEWCIDALYVVDDKTNKCVTFKNGDWLFDTIYKEINNDIGWQDIITRKCSDED